jgi:proteasome accessory factor C
MPKINNFNGEDRYNFMLSLVGFLQNRGAVSVDEAAAHFDLESKYLRKVVTSINEARAEVSGFEQWFFMIDIEELEQNGVLSLIDNLVVDDVPKLSNRQASAIAAGLNYLATLPAFKDDADLKELQDLLSANTIRGINPIVELRPGSAEAGAETLRRAIMSETQISCEYINQKGDRSVRTIEPLRLDPRTDGWYLRAFCPIHQEVRNFKLDRMRSIELLDSARSSAAEKVNEIEDAVYIAAASDARVLIEVEPEAYRLISEIKNIGEPLNAENGKIRAEIRVGHLPNIGRMISKYGGAAKVISPVEAKDLVRNYALAALGQQVQSTIEDED